jgi:hypothetical protein
MWICKRVIMAAAVITVSLIALISPASAVQILNIQISGGFDDGHQFDIIPFTLVGVGATKDLSFGSYTVPFQVTYIRTDQLGPDSFADVVTISYGPLSGTPFLGNPSRFTFSGYNTRNHLMPIADVLDHSSSFREASSLPERMQYVDFQTQGPGLPDSAPDTGFFTLSFLNLTEAPPRLPVPASLPLLITGMAALGFAGWRRHRRSSTGTPAQ